MPPRSRARITEPSADSVRETEVLSSAQPAGLNGGTIRHSMESVEEQSSIVKTIVDEVVGRHSRELDEFVTNIKLTLERIKAGTARGITDRALELSSIKLPVLLYFAGEGLEHLGCESDVAKAKRLEEYNNILMTAQGTIPNRQALAESATFYYTMVDSVYARAYKQLKSKMEQADKLFSALKKVLSKRMMEMDISRRELQVNMPEDESDLSPEIQASITDSE